jgi:predicted DNA-binding transcriptional regulator AlpA
MIKAGQHGMMVAIVDEFIEGRFEHWMIRPATYIHNGFPQAAASCNDVSGESQTSGNDTPSASDDDDDGGDDDGEPARRPLPYPPALFSFESLSAYTQLNRTRVYSLIRQGKFPRPLKFGKTSRWRKSDVDAWIAAEAAVQLEG